MSERKQPQVSDEDEKESVENVENSDEEAIAGRVRRFRAVLPESRRFRRLCRVNRRSLNFRPDEFTVLGHMLMQILTGDVPRLGFDASGHEGPLGPDYPHVDRPTLPGLQNRREGSSRNVNTRAKTEDASQEISRLVNDPKCLRCAGLNLQRPCIGTPPCTECFIKGWDEEECQRGFKKERKKKNRNRKRKKGGDSGDGDTVGEDKKGNGGGAEPSSGQGGANFTGRIAEAA
jgi:hypothetical protein